MKLLITICARGGSKGIPGKNIKEIGDKPLIAYSISTAKRFAALYDCDIELSTDSAQIKEVAAKYGLPSEYLRPDNLATDKAGKIEVLHDILAYSEKLHSVRYDYILDLDVTSPLRTVDDLSRAFDVLKESNEAYNLFSVSPANRNPYFNMVEQKENGFYGVVKSSDGFLTRQSAPRVFDLNASFYFYRREFFEKDLKGAITNRSLIYEVPHLCFDLDHPIDFEFMQYLIENNKLGFEL